MPDREALIELSKLFEQARLNQRWSQQDAAKRASIGTSSWSNLEKGAKGKAPHNPSEGLVLAAMKIFGADQQAAILAAYRTATANDGAAASRGGRRHGGTSLQGQVVDLTNAVAELNNRVATLERQVQEMADLGDSLTAERFQDETTTGESEFPASETPGSSR